MDDGPQRLWLIRHGESAGNVAREAAEASGADVIDIDGRDMDVPLSRDGRAQAEAVGAWLRSAPPHDRPTLVVSSPYVRAVQTATGIAGALDLDPAALVVDDRLREREFGVLDRLTRRGIERRFPDQAALRARLGKFYHRPPSGESWCDVGLRVRSFLLDVTREAGHARVAVVSHQVVVLMLRYVLEHLTEPQILAVDRSGDLANCSVAQYAKTGDRWPHGTWERRLWNHVAPIRGAGQPVTAERGPAETVEAGLDRAAGGRRGLQRA